MGRAVQRDGIIAAKPCSVGTASSLRADMSFGTDTAEIQKLENFNYSFYPRC
jgi:hypothetical protein